ncbi:MAG: hypothetical protein R6V15_13345, partial [Desulfotignum sp.]
MARFWTGKRAKALAAVLMGAVLIQGCGAVTPVPRTLDTLPKAIHTPSAKTLNFSLASPWWEQFSSQELNRLITHALTHNFSIRQARDEYPHPSSTTSIILLV